jgi:hypothetical protein
MPGAYGFDAFPKHAYASMLPTVLKNFDRQGRRAGCTPELCGMEQLSLLSLRPNTIVYLSRTNGMKPRIMENEHAFIEALEKTSVRLGFQLSVFKRPAKDPLEDVRLFRGARVVVGIHGGALANIVWCQKNTHVVEINKDEHSDGGEQLLVEDNPRHMYAHMSHSLDLHYHAFVPTRFPRSYNNESHSSVVVDVARFNAYFLQLLNEHVV